MHPCRFLLALVVVGSFAGPTSCLAAARHVPSEYSTINAALDAAVAGDSVLVSPGVYDQYETRLLGDGILYSAVAFLKGGVALVSEAGPSSTTMRIDSSVATGRVCRAFSETGNIEVAGFTLSGTASDMNAISISFSDRLIVRDCVFEDIGSGAGIGSVSVDLEMYGCRFENIHANSGSALNQTSGTLLIEDSEFINCREGAMSLRWDDSFPHANDLTVRRCRFVGNQSTFGGTAIAVGYLSVLIEDCWFEGNQGGGSTVSTAAGVQTIRNCTLLNGYGGTGVTAGIRVAGASMLMEGNTFWGNHVDLDGPTGGAAVVFGTGSAIFRNNVIVNSTGDQAVRKGAAATLQTSCNVYWDNPLGNTSGFQPDATDLQADPMFCDVGAKDFHVNAASPCIPGNGHPSCTELIGAWDAACGVVSVEPWSWGRIKSAYRAERVAR